MNIRRALVGLLSAVVRPCCCWASFSWMCMTSDVEPDLSYRTLDYDVVVHRNGDLKVTQHIDMRLNDRGFDWKQMYQQYTLKAKNLTDISDVGVKDVSNGETYVQVDLSSPHMSPIGTLSMQVSGISWTSLRTETILSRSILRQMV